MIADVLTFKGFRGWSCGDSYATLAWDDVEAGRAKPSEVEIAAWELEYIADKVAQAQQDTADAATHQSVKGKPFTQWLVSHSDAEIEAWINANVTDLASAKDTLGKLASIVRVLAVKVLR